MPTHSKRTPRLYIAHPYRATARGLVDLNIQAARLAGVAAVRAGWFPVMPTVNTAGFDELLPEIPDAFWLEGTLGLLATCDAVLMAGNWWDSEGCRGEYAEAQMLGLPIYLPNTLPKANGAIA
jgi:hypothetical protein